MSNCRMEQDQLRLTTFQKIWLSSSGIGGSERGVDRITTGTTKLGVPSTVLTCGEYYRGALRPKDYVLPSFPEHSEGKKVLSIPTVAEIADYLCGQELRKLGVFQMAWGFEHYPSSMIQCLNIIGLPKIFITMEIHQFDQLTQELGSHQLKTDHINAMKRKIDVLVAISTPLLQEAKQLGFKDTRLIYLPVDTDIFHPVQKHEKYQIREQLGIPTDKNVALFVGRVVEEKGIRFIIEAFRELNQKNNNKWHLIIAGGIKIDDELHDEFLSFLREYPSQVTYLGVLTDEKEVSRIMQISDVFVYPTIHQEGLGLSVAEAMSCGLPVITTSFGARETGMIDLIQTGTTGFVFDEKHGGVNLANTLKSITTGQLELMGQCARQRVFDLKMDSTSVAMQWYNLLLEVQNKYSNVVM